MFFYVKEIAKNVSQSHKTQGEVFTFPKRVYNDIKDEKKDKIHTCETLEQEKC